MEELAAFGREFGFEVLVAPDLNIENERLSSSRIREWISCGNLRKVSEGFAGQWITSASVDEEGLIRFEAFQCLPPSGTYQVEILQVTGALRSREILELHQGRTAQLTIRAGATFGEVLIAGWSPIDLY
ncbi:hypothetical protein ASC96_26595 [Rhizobium sp. Root1204]|nr:hypothetical protein ASC96_26595 [Rhizobium sp. Root1204]